MQRKIVFVAAVIAIILAIWIALDNKTENSKYSKNINHAEESFVAQESKKL